MILDEKVRKLRFAEKVREFCRNLKLKGKDVLVAGIIGTAALIGRINGQEQDSSVVDTSSVKIDYTYVDWEKPPFMGLTYAYYKKKDELAYVLNRIARTAIEMGASSSDMEALYISLDSLYIDWGSRFPYSTPATRQDTLDAIRYYFDVIYHWSWQQLDNQSYEKQVKTYIRTHPNKGVDFLRDLDIINNSPYRDDLLNSTK